ncbi:SMI1/KNR4 family protein [Streptomyces violascens]|uniref:SMI1/KNR4 family protein n=1 Tax=Streptomyces violascens TaxID=67381 RepID=UPI00366147B5
MTDDITGRQVTDAWRRIEGWLREHAPATYAALGPGADDEQINAVENALGFAVPVELRMLWGLVSGGNVKGRGPWRDNNNLISLDEVIGHYRLKLKIQADLDENHEKFARLEEDRAIAWQRLWIPVFSTRVYDTSHGAFLDAGNGLMWKWTRYAYIPPTDKDPQDSIVTYMEDLADALEYPALAEDTPGLVEGALVWRSCVRAGEDWRASLG